MYYGERWMKGGGERGIESDRARNRASEKETPGYSPLALGRGFANLVNATNFILAAGPFPNRVS